MILVKRKEPTEESHVKLVAYTIILYISSLFVPFVVVASYQSIFYFSRSQWFFSTPFSAYITFMCAMIYIAVVLTVYLILRQRWEGRTFNWITGILVLASLPAFFLSLTNYYFLDDRGIHYNTLTGLNETEYKWKNISKVNIIYRNDQGTTGLYQYKFEMDDGSIVTLPFNDKMAEHHWRVDEIIKVNKIPVKDNFKNPIVD